jgi:hypothetical protein
MADTNPPSATRRWASSGSYGICAWMAVEFSVWNTPKWGADLNTEAWPGQMDADLVQQSNLIRWKFLRCE